MKKFPVISENGNEYLVRIHQGTLADGLLRVDVYQKRVGLFGIRRNKKLNNRRCDYSHYNEAKWEYDYIEMAQNAIRKVEYQVAESKRVVVLREYNAKKFEEWDGDCR